MDLMRMLRDCD